MPDLSKEEQRVLKNQKERARWKALRDAKLLDAGIDPATRPISADGARGKQIGKCHRDIPDEFKYPKDGETYDEWHKRYRAEIARRSYEKHGERWKEGIRERYKENHEHVRAVKKDWHRRNPGKQKEYDKRLIDNNPERINALREWQKNNPEKFAEAKKQWYVNNPHMNAAYSSRRRATERQQSPMWADWDKIADIHKECIRRSEDHGLQYHVDHIVPLRGKNMSGLHVDYNLRIISAKDNVVKRASVDEALIVRLMKKDWERIIPG